MMLDANFELNQSVIGITERLEKGIPFKKIDIDNLRLDLKEGDKINNCPPGIMDDIDYDYCYKNLLIETKEWYTTLQALKVYLAGKQVPEKKLVAKKPIKQKEVQDKDAPQPRCENLKKTVDQKTKLQSYQVLNFSSDKNMVEFMQFLAEYMAFTEKQIHLTILIGDIVEQSIRYSNIDQFNQNLKNDEELQGLIEAAQKQKDQDDKMQGEEPGSANPTARVTAPKQSINQEYKFMSIDQLEHFKEAYLKSISQLTLRMYKSVFAIYKLYPNFNAFEHLSIFDKVYQLQLITHSFGQYQFDNLQEIQRMQLPQLFDFEHQAQLLLKDGGIKNKDLEVIQETSKIIRDQIDSKLEYAYDTHELTPDFFISSRDFSQVWNGSIINHYSKKEKFQFKVGLDQVKMAYQKHLGGNHDGALTDEAFDLFKAFLPAEEEALTSFQTIKLVDLVNFTDFIEFHTIINIYSPDQVLNCLEQIKKEKTIIQELFNQNFSSQKTQSSGGFVAAGTSKVCFDPMGQAQNLVTIDKMIEQNNSSILDQNVFLRTPRSLENGDWDLLYMLNLFGVKHILNEEMRFGLYMKDRLESDLLTGCEQNDNEMLAKYYKHVDKIQSKTYEYPMKTLHIETVTTLQEEEIASPTSVDKAKDQVKKQVRIQTPVDSMNSDNEEAQPSSPVDKKINPKKMNRNMTVIPSKRVQIMTPEQELTQPVSSSNTTKRSQTVGGKAMKKKIEEEEVDQNLENFMTDLDYEGCHMMGIDSILQVNEVYENFQDVSAQHQSMEEDGFNEKLQKQKQDRNSNILLSVIDEHPDFQFASKYNEASLKRHNNIQDVLTRQLQNKKIKIQKQMENQLGETFGDFEKIKEDEEYENFVHTDKGYLLMFHSANEAKFISRNYIFQKIIQGSHFLTMEVEEPISTTYRLNPNYPQKPPSKDKYDEWGFQKFQDRAKAYLPVCIPFKELLVKAGKKEHILNQRILEYYMFRDLNTILQRQHISRILKNPNDFKQPLNIPQADLNILKKYVLKHQKLHFYKRQELHHFVKLFKVRQIIGKRFYDIFTKLSAISTDGFQREQHVIKIQHWTDEVTKAQNDLSREEHLVESGQLAMQDAQNLSESIQRITTLMINIERWTAQKVQMEETLKAEEQDWIQNDTIYKQRRIILNYIIKLNLDMVYDTHAYVQLSHQAACNLNLSGSVYELIFFMIQHILSQNRMPSINFMAEINQFIQSQQEEMIQLNNTQFELTSKVLAIEEEKREMGKRIDEMKSVCDLKDRKEELVILINDMDTKIAQLKKQLGKGQPPPPEEIKK